MRTEIVKYVTYSTWVRKVQYVSVIVGGSNPQRHVTNIKKLDDICHMTCQQNFLMVSETMQYLDAWNFCDIYPR
jgi:hypothetical protein